MLLLAFVCLFAVCSLGGMFLLKPKASDKTVTRAIEIISSRQTMESDLTFSSQRGGGWKHFVEELGRVVEHFHFSEDLNLLILHSGSKTTVGSVVAVSCLSALAAGFVCHLFVGILPLDLLAVVVGASVRWGLLKFQKARRLKKFGIVLPEAIDLLSRALRAGHSIGSAIEIVSEQTREPLAAEFDTVFQQQKFGIPFRDAVLELGERVPSKDLHFLITAILVQRETGGDLTEILDRTSRVIRDRVRIEGEIRTYTAQGRLTGWILSALPVLMLVLINILSPGYSTVLFHDPIGRMLLYGGAALIGVGGFIISRIVDIKV
jgi:tight adherence protein B